MEFACVRTGFIAVAKQRLVGAIDVCDDALGDPADQKFALVLRRPAVNSPRAGNKPVCGRFACQRRRCQTKSVADAKNCQQLRVRRNGEHEFIYD
jgi:hypothetical protein